jgi:hypothetical protein
MTSVGAGTDLGNGARPGSVHRTLEILEVVAARGGASAKERRGFSPADNHPGRIPTRLLA